MFKQKLETIKDIKFFPEMSFLRDEDCKHFINGIS